MNDIVHAEAAPKAISAYPHARRLENLLFLSDVGPRNPHDNSIPGNVLDSKGTLVDYDIEAQCRQVFANVRVVLEASGARWQDLVDVTGFLTDMQPNCAICNRVHAEYFIDAQQRCMLISLVLSGTATGPFRLGFEPAHTNQHGAAARSPASTAFRDRRKPATLASHRHPLRGATDGTGLPAGASASDVSRRSGVVAH